MATAKQISMSVLDDSKPHTFNTPIKRISDGQDVSLFLLSEAYRDIMTFLMLLNRALFPSLLPDTISSQQAITSWEIDSSNVHFSNVVLDLRKLLYALNMIIDEVPLDTGPRRFGNVSFRKWSNVVESRITGLLQQYLPQNVSFFKHDSECDAISEIKAYLLESFGSSQRLDYGTGHELSFLAFLGCIWKLGGFRTATGGEEERGIVLGIIEPYLALIRRLIQTYSLEPAGSHGVWGLDDHSFLPYIFGSAQYGPSISPTDPIPTEGSREGAPAPGDVVKANLVEQERKKNMYFSAIGFIYDVKTGPFWEHSPTLFDISGVRAGWGKINKGMIKMYNAEVLSKFPVVQHFPFGSLFSWNQDSNNIAPEGTSIHASHQPTRSDTGPMSTSKLSMQDLAQSRTRVLQTDTTADLPDITSNTQAPWVGKGERPLAVSNHITLGGVGAKRAYGTNQMQTQSKTVVAADDSTDTTSSVPPPMKAPWAT